MVTHGGRSTTTQPRSIVQEQNLTLVLDALSGDLAFLGLTTIPKATPQAGSVCER
jgi:hypothetical protein